MSMNLNNRATTNPYPLLLVGFFLLAVGVVLGIVRPWEGLNVFSATPSTQEIRETAAGFDAIVDQAKEFPSPPAAGVSAQNSSILGPTARNVPVAPTQSKKFIPSSINFEELSYDSGKPVGPQFFPEIVLYDMHTIAEMAPLSPETIQTSLILDWKLSAIVTMQEKLLGKRILKGSMRPMGPDEVGFLWTLVYDNANRGIANAFLTFKNGQVVNAR